MWYLRCKRRTLTFSRRSKISFFYVHCRCTGGLLVWLLYHTTVLALNLANYSYTYCTVVCTYTVVLWNVQYLRKLIIVNVKMSTKNYTCKDNASYFRENILMFSPSFFQKGKSFLEPFLCLFLLQFCQAFDQSVSVRPTRLSSQRRQTWHWRKERKIYYRYVKYIRVHRYIHLPYHICCL